MTRENFLLDIRRGKIDLLKATNQNRARQTIVLVRLDLGGAPHRNPDGEEILENASGFYEILYITKPPIIQKGIEETTGSK